MPSNWLFSVHLLRCLCIMGFCENSSAILYDGMCSTDLKSLTKVDSMVTGGLSYSIISIEPFIGHKSDRIFIDLGQCSHHVYYEGVCYKQNHSWV